MIRGVVIALPILSLLFFPAPVAGILALLAAFYTPWAPLAVGVVADALYYTHGVGLWPIYSLVGAFATLAAILVRRFVETSIMH